MADQPLRVLLLTRNLPPLVGGMERLNWHIADELSKHAQVKVIAPIGSRMLKPPGVDVVEVPLSPSWRFLMESMWQSIQTARTWKPDLVLAGSGLMAPAALVTAKLIKARSCVYLHGLDAAVKHLAYETVWHPAIRNVDTVIANSRSTAELAKTLGVPELKMKVVHPGVAIPVSLRSTVELQNFRRRHNLGDRPVLLSIGRLTSRKGLREFVQNSLPAVAERFPDALLAIVGDAPAHSLHASVQSKESIQAVAEAVGVGQNIRFLGVITNQDELACAFQCADLHVFPVRSISGDPEGFGMVSIEAAAHGLPTVAFASGGVVDAVAEGQSGRLVPSGDYVKLSEAILDVLGEGRDRWASIATAFAENFAWPVFGDRLSIALGLTSESK